MPGNHFADGPLPELDSWLDDQSYSAMLDSIVLACVDVLVRDQDEWVLLGLRSREPHPDWWLFGGRMRRGESFEQAAAFNLERELGLSLPAERFRYVASYSTVFPRRAQAPAENGVHTANAVCEVVLDAAEIARLSPDDEYVRIAWLSAQEIRTDHDLHAFLRQTLVDAARS